MHAELLADDLGWPEGPGLMPSGDIVFVETYRGRISAWSVADGVREFAFLGGGPNAVVVTPEGGLVVAQNGGVVGPWRSDDPRPPSIQTVGTNGKVETVATAIDGITLRAPNDLVRRDDGRIYFTDSGGDFDPVGRKDPGFVFELNPDGSGRCLAELGAVYPNGITINDSGDVVWTESYTRAVRSVDANGTIATLGAVPERSIPDGLTVGDGGRLYVTGCGSAKVEILAAGGETVADLAVGTVPTNCTFDGADLIVTDAGHPGDTVDAKLIGKLWRVRDVRAAGGRNG